MSEQETLGLEDKRFESMKSGKVKYKSASCSERQVRVNAWTRTPQGWKFAAWQSCPMPA